MELSLRSDRRCLAETASVQAKASPSPPRCRSCAYQPLGGKAHGSVTNSETQPAVTALVTRQTELSTATERLNFVAYAIGEVVEEVTHEVHHLGQLLVD